MRNRAHPRASFKIIPHFKHPVHVKHLTQWLAGLLNIVANVQHV